MVCKDFISSFRKWQKLEKQTGGISRHRKTTNFMGILKYRLKGVRDRLREVTAEFPVLLPVSVTALQASYSEISPYWDCFPARSPQNPAFLSVLHWQKEDKLNVHLLVVTHSCKAFQNTLAALKSRMFCILLLASAALHSKHLSSLWLFDPPQDLTSQSDALLFKKPYLINTYTMRVYPA